MIIPIELFSDSIDVKIASWAHFALLLSLRTRVHYQSAEKAPEEAFRLAESTVDKILSPMFDELAKTVMDHPTEARTKFIRGVLKGAAEIVGDVT